MYLDKNGLIVQANGDGGDTAQRTGFYFSGRQLCMNWKLPLPVYPSGLTDFTTAVKLLTPNGLLIRNPIQYNDPKDTSRDQTRPMIIACGLYRLNFAVRLISPKGFTYENGDLVSPENANEIRRAFGCSGMPLGNLWMIGDAITRCKQAKETGPDDVGDDVNLICTLAQAYFVDRGSWLVEKAITYYFNNRPINFGNTLLGEKDPVMGALAWYFRTATGGNPEIAELWRPIISYMRGMLKCSLTA